MLTCCVIADRDTAVGFRLAGVKVAAADTPAEAEAHLTAILEEGQCGLLLIVEQLALGLSEQLQRRVERAGLPLVVPLPMETAWRGEERSLQYLLELIRRSIGYQMRISR